MIVTIIVLAVNLSQVSAPATPMIGVLEERPGANTEEAARFVVRALFHKDAAGWQSYDPNCSDETCLASAPARAPQETRWTISNHGQSLGEVTAHTPPVWAFYADVGQQELANGATAPTFGERTDEFTFSATPLYRPLVATSLAASADPQSWADAPLTTEAQLAVRQLFRTRFTDVINCANDFAPPQPRAYTDDDIEISQTYVSSTGWRIATARLTGYACDGPFEGAYAEQTFAISPTNEARLLDDGLRFLDAGDYDNDGQSEVVFVINQYNVGGYALYTNDFAQSVVFDFSYH